MTKRIQSKDARRWRVGSTIFLSLSILLFYQCGRLAFWKERRIHYAGATEFAGVNLQVRLVERLTPRVARFVFHIPPECRIQARPVIDRGEEVEPQRSPVNQYETFKAAGHLQLICYLAVGNENYNGWWWGEWSDLSGVSMEPRGSASGLFFPDKHSGWEMVGAEHCRLQARGEGQYFLPLYVNDQGHRIGLEIIEEQK